MASHAFQVASKVAINPVSHTRVSKKHTIPRSVNSATRPKGRNLVAPIATLSQSSGPAPRPTSTVSSSQQSRNIVPKAVAEAAPVVPETKGPRTLFDKIWDDHVIDVGEDGTALIFIDRHLVHEVTSPQAFEGLRTSGRSVRRVDCTLATVDHNVPTSSRAGFTDVGSFIKEEDSLQQVQALEKNVKEFGITYFGMDDNRQGIVHIIGPEQGFTLPGMTIVCGDSHTSTHGAFGALAFGIGTSEVEHVLATQTLVQKPALNMRIAVEGDLLPGVTSKDLILHIISVIGTAGGTGHVIEFTGPAVASLSMEARMTMCNMAIEGGARAGMVAPDDITFEYLRGKPMAPHGEDFDKAVEYWRSLASDDNASYAKEVVIKAADVIPTVTWGTSPQDAGPINSNVPDPALESDPQRKAAIERALNYMGLQPGQAIEGTPIDKVFIGSCTNARIEDIRAAAAIAKGRKVVDSVYAMVVPGSGLVKEQAEAEGLHTILIEAGFDWREPGCSMCLAMNPDKLEPGERCASTSNRNFESRQGQGGRTHLCSPAMAAAAAVTGTLCDVRNLPPIEEPEPEPAASAGMDPFTVLKGVAAPLDVMNIDTDMIIPKQFLKTIKRTGLGVSAFYDMRYNPEDGSPRPDFVLNNAPYDQAKIIIAGDNFGCGSSREHAPWALKDFGITCVISTSFADIFFNNCFKNGMLPIALPADDVAALMSDANSDDCEIEVDLANQIITRPGGKGQISFDVDPFRKHCLLNGLDDIGLTLQKDSKIAAFEEKRAASKPWL